MYRSVLYRSTSATKSVRAKIHLEEVLGHAAVDLERLEELHSALHLLL